ncbi:MAG TPA: tetratricopeptide repeat protein [Nitrospirota bacterium]|nr:tetratricopeptide repeat protein [Nitrospirota bacterium]
MLTLRRPLWYFYSMAVDKHTVMKEAQKFAARGQYDRAIAEWKKLLRESPHDANLYNTIGDLCLKKDAKADAVDAYRRAADILASDGFTSKAIALYKKTLNIDPRNIEVYLALGDLNAEKGLTGNALENYKIVADHYTQQKNLGKALGIYQKMADLNSADVAFRIKLADMYAKQGMVAEASKAYLDAADVHLSKNALNDARQLFEKVLALNPENKEVYYKAGIVYLKEGKFSEACKALKPAFEKDPNNRDLADTYVEALVSAGKDHDAELVLRKIIDANPDRIDSLQKLYTIFLARKDYDRALDMATALSNAFVAQDDQYTAEDYLKKFVAACPRYTPGFLKLAEFYVSVRQDDDAARTFLQTAEILSDEGDREGAKTVLGRALDINPELPGARELFTLLNTPAITVPSSPEPEELGIPAPVTKPLEREPAAPEPAVSVLETLVEEPPIAEAPIVEAPVMESPSVAPPTERAPVPEVIDPAITEACAEIDILVKYGLATKALEQLEDLARKYPENIQIRVKLSDLYGDLGQMGKSATHMIVLADLYTARGMQDKADGALRTALTIDPANTEVQSRLHGEPAVAMPKAQPDIVVPEEQPIADAELPVFPLDVLDTAEYRPAEVMQEVETTPPSPEEPAPEPAPTDESVFEGLDIDAPQAAEVGSSALFTPPSEPESQPVAIESPAFVEEAPPVAGESQPAEETAATVTEPTLEEEVAGQAAETPVQEPAGEVDINEIWAEAEFYYQQGLFNEAKKHYAKLIELDPDEKQAIARLAEISREEEETKEFTRLADAVEGLEGALSAEPTDQELPLSASDEEAVRSLMSEIESLKKPTQQPASPAPPRTVVEPTAAVTGPGRGDEEEEFFDLGEELQKESRPSATGMQEQKADDFFDLASELRDELSGVAVPARPTAKEQSLDEIFEEFKRGVEQSTNEDVDTHYNLGVAYKEMGLLDDAIAEFSLTPEGEPKFVHSRYMLGLCYMEKGEYENAIVEIEYALTYLEGMGEDEQARLEMRYDLGLAYQGVGNIINALREFQRIQNIKPGYRDIAAKLKELTKGDFISLDQLKGDIEKEISSKFLEEGERIEREEKNRKNARVRN